MSSPSPEALPVPRDNSNNNLTSNNSNSTLKQQSQSPSDLTTTPPIHPRRSSFNFLRRSKSTEPLADRKASGGRSKKAREAAAREEELRRQREAIPQSPPRLPGIQRPPQMATFGGDDNSSRPDSVAIMSGRFGNMNNVPNGKGGMPYRPNGPMNGSSNGNAMRGGSAPPTAVPKAPDFDPYARTESMAHRGRYSYASSAVSTVNSPRRVRRRKDPTPYK